MEINKNIVFESFAGRITPLQKTAIEKWLRSPDNIELYYEWLNEWELANAQFSPDTATALKKITQHNDDAAVIPSLPVDTSRRNHIARLFRSRSAAAIIIFLFISVGVFSLRNSIIYRSMTTGFGETRSVILPDGSLVSMNANSTIRYSRLGFGNKNREVYLSGEADFSVTHDNNNRPFLVHTDNNLDVVVLGTRFAVYARGQQARVVLQQGKVELNFREAGQDRRLILRPGDLFASNTISDHNSLQHVQSPENFSAWKNHEFLFDSTSLAEFAVTIRDDFGLTIHFANPALAEHRISGSFHADTANELLDAISQLLNIRYKTQKDTIYLSD
jgi:ferric-dicitrate binding protein FerR (iron transport regulator)